MNHFWLKYCVGSAVLIGSMMAYATLHPSAPHFYASAESRRTFADGLQDEVAKNPAGDIGMSFGVGAPDNRALILYVSVNSPSYCDAMLDTMAQDESFMESVRDAGFSELWCYGRKFDDVKTTIVTRKVPPPPEPPIVEPAKPAWNGQVVA